MSKSIGSIGFVGLGVMGEHMCRNLLSKIDLPGYLYDVSSEALSRQTGKNANPCASVKEVVEHSDIVFLSLPAITQVEEVCLGEGGLVSGETKPAYIVDMSTSDVARTRELAKKLADHGVRFIDAPVARMVEAAKSGTLLIMVGAPSDAQFQVVKPYLECMGKDVVHCGDIGCGQIVKIANNMVLMMNVAVLAECLLICENAGVDGEKLFDVLSIGSATSEALRNAGIKSLAPRAFPPNRFSAAYALKDVELATSLAVQGGVDARILERTRDLLQATVDAGSKDEYYAKLIEHIATR